MVVPVLPEHAADSSRREAAGYLAVVAATACWGTSGILAKFVVAEAAVSALALAFWRDLFTFGLLFVALRILRPAWLRVARRDLVWLACLGTVGVGIFHVFWSLSVLLNGVAVTTVQQAIMPGVVAVAARFLWREPLTRRKLLAIALTFGGTFLISGPGVHGGAALTLPGLLVGLGVPITYAGYSIFGKPVAGRYPPPTILTYGFGFAALALLPLQVFTPQPWPVPHLAWLWFAALLAVATIVPFSAYTFGLGRLPASVAGIVAMTEIPLAAAYAYLLLGERLTAAQIAGAGLVVAGVLMLSMNMEGCAMAKNKGTAKTMPMRVLEEKGIAYEAHQQARKQFTAEGVAADLRVPVAQVLKAMIVGCSGGRFALVVIRGDQHLSLKKVSAALQDKDVALASERDVLRVTGYQVGAVSVLGFRRKDVPGYVDRQVLALEQVIISAGRPDMGLALAPSDFLQAVSGAQVGDYCQ